MSLAYKVIWKSTILISDTTSHTMTVTSFGHLDSDNLSKPAPERLNHSGFQWSKRWWRITWTICKSFAPRFRHIITQVPHYLHHLDIFSNFGSACGSKKLTRGQRTINAGNPNLLWTQMTGSRPTHMANSLICPSVWSQFTLVFTQSINEPIPLHWQRYEN